ncbi:MAG: rRNA maturation RNase YbeY [Candidatus Dependentiae bacterium]
MIKIKNTQKSVKLDLKKIKQDAQIVLDALDYSDFDLGIWFTSNKTIRSYNKQYRNKDKATDVLSFPYHDTLKAGERIKVKSEDDKNLGDLILAPQYIIDDLPRWNDTFEHHMQRLLVHGVCHLLGYDHIKDEDYKVMKRKENALLKKLAEGAKK